MNEPIINKVAESGLITIDLETYYPKGETAVFDLKDHLEIIVLVIVLVTTAPVLIKIFTGKNKQQVS